MMLLPLFIALPFAGAFMFLIFNRRVNRAAKPIAGAIAAFMAVASLWAVWLQHTRGVLVYAMGGWIPPYGICFVLDGLSALMLVTVNIVGFCALIYSFDYIERFTSAWQYFTLFLLMIAGMNGIVLTGDLFNLYVFMELSAVTCYALVAYGCEHEELEASFRYMVLGSVASVFILLGIAFIYGHTGTLNMADIARELALRGSPAVLMLVTGLFVLGFGLKAALVPFHAWLPDAHPSAPAPISAMLSGVAIKTMGIYALVRIVYNVFGNIGQVSPILMMLGSLSMLVGVVLAFAQWDFKRLLAYHSISQIGYVALGFGLGTPLGILGALLHLMNHSVFKSLLFLNAGAVEYATDTRQLQEMGGLRERMPVTGGTAMIASMSIAGIPPFNGFWSKLIIIIAAVQAGAFVHGGVAVLVSVLTLVSFVKVLRYAFFGALKERWKTVREVPLSMTAAMIVLAILCVLMGLLLVPGIRQVVLQPAVDVLRGGVTYSSTVFGSLL